jgi:uroporphyrinogen decarboxylase
MNSRERYLKTMHFAPVDHPPFVLPGGPWGTTLRRWHKEGLPEGVGLDEFFGTEPVRFSHVGVETVLFPPFQEKVLEETDRFVVRVNNRGVKVRDFKDMSSMPEFLEYPIKGPVSLGWLKKKLDWNTPGRAKADWLADAARRRAQGEVLFCNGGMYFAFLNEHAGTERLMYAYFESPDFVNQVNEMLCVLCENTLRTVLPHFKVDQLGYHEDMAYKAGSMISPAMFREFMTPYYKRVTAIAYEHGIDLHLMDCDGNIRELIPLWLECGINAVTPVEVAAGMDVVALRKEYGRELRMMGGFDKRILASTKAAIKKEFERLRPVIEGGGYIPGCDHGVPHDVPFDNYRYLVELLKQLYGLR